MSPLSTAVIPMKPERKAKGKSYKAKVNSGKLVKLETNTHSQWGVIKSRQSEQLLFIKFHYIMRIGEAQLDGSECLVRGMGNFLNWHTSGYIK